MSERMWSCSHDGPHPDNTARWCEHGCGRDYNSMVEVELDDLTARALRSLDRNSKDRFKQSGRASRAEAKVKRLERELKEIKEDMWLEMGYPKRSFEA